MKYLKESKIIGIILDYSVIADLISIKPQFNNLSQTTLWTIKNDPLLKEKIDEFKILE